MKLLLIAALAGGALAGRAPTLKVDVGAMPRVVFTGDSQTCGRVGAWDYPQMLSWELPIRVLNTGVGGTNTRHLLSETTGGTAEVKRGEREVKGTKVSWHAGPYPGQKVRLGTQEYTIDRIAVTSYADSRTSLWLTEPAREDFSGTDYAIEPGWRVRVAEQRPDYACFMYSVNDTGYDSPHFLANIAEIVQRTRKLGAQPILLSGVPYMEKNKGGSHPGTNEKVAVRARDLAGFCQEQKVPFGDVFGALMLLDEPCTSVWVDTVHPTTDGSTAIIHALRTIFRELGVSANPYYVRGYRSKGGCPAPDDRPALTHFTTSQPDYSAANVQDEAHFDLAAIRARDEYGLIAAADGQAVASETPLLLKFGVGPREKLSLVQVEVVARPAVRVMWYDWPARQWRLLAEGESVEGALPRGVLPAAWHDGAIWLAVEGPGKFGLDYAGVTLVGAVAPFRPQPQAEPIVWPAPGELTWDEHSGNLIPNGSFADVQAEGPAHWQPRGADVAFIRAGTVAQGTGDFVLEKRVDLFRAADQHFLQTVRPLDVLTIGQGPEHAKGRFLISQVLDDETARVRRFPHEPVAGVAFEVHRSSGCLAVPGGCAVQCQGESTWETSLSKLPAGQYRLGFFHRAYDPANMRAKGRPGRAGRVGVLAEAEAPVAVADQLEGSYQWQRDWLGFGLERAGAITIRLGANGPTPVQYTGLTLLAQ